MKKLNLIVGILCVAVCLLAVRVWILEKRIDNPRIETISYPTVSYDPGMNNGYMVDNFGNRVPLEVN